MQIVENVIIKQYVLHILAVHSVLVRNSAISSSDRHILVHSGINS